MKKSSLLALGISVLLFLAAPQQGWSQGKGNGNGKGKGNSGVQQKTPGPPPWAPAHGYRAKTRYTYFKDYDVYYDNTRGVYISLNGGNWSITTRLPTRLTSVNLVTAVKVDIDLDADDPQRYHSEHRKKYPKKN